MKVHAITRLFLITLALAVACGTTALAKKPPKPDDPPDDPPVSGYLITDLGTLGGEESTAEGMRGSWIVGRAWTEDGSNLAVLWEITDTGILTHDLGTLPYGSASAAFAVNGAGQVVGTSENGDLMEDPDNPGEYIPVERAVLWRTPTSAPEDLGTLPGGRWSLARAISDTGFIVGQSEKAEGCAPGREYCTRAALWRIDSQGNVQGPVDLLLASGVGYGVNSYGLVAVADPWTPWVLVPEDTDSDGQPDLWARDDDGDGRNDLLEPLGYLDEQYPYSYINAINDAGQVSGRSGSGFKRGSAGCKFHFHAYRITPEDTDGDGSPDLWLRPNRRDGTNDLMEDLGHLNGYEGCGVRPGSEGRAINGSGTVAGSDYVNRSFAVLFQDGKVINLEEEIPEGSGFSDLILAAGINDAGLIAGSGHLESGAVRAFLLTPQ